MKVGLPAKKSDRHYTYGDYRGWPDLIVVCDPAKLYPRGCRGAPDWVIEILSPYTSSKDMHEKRELYEEHGVGEYWLLDPAGRYAHVYLLQADGGFEGPQIHVAPAAIASTTCQGLEIDLEALCDFAESGG